jgi:peptidoglycan/xylan/chitin deacetylase (PgdA/CDA1 family)
LASYNEGLPIAALEAISAGAPVLLSNIEANRVLGLSAENDFQVGKIDRLCYKLSQEFSRYRLDALDRQKILKRTTGMRFAPKRIRFILHWSGLDVRFMAFKHTVFSASFKTLAAVRADRWLGFLARGIGVILMLHHVRPPRSRKFAPNQGLEITPDFLDAALTQLRREGFELVPLDAVPARLRQGSAAHPFAVVTFDDGYRDNVQYAWPVLRQHSAPWTVFVTTDFLDGGGHLWWLELEEAIARLDSVALPGDGKPVVISSRTVAEKERAFRFIYHKLWAGPRDQLRRTTAALAARAAVDTRRLVRDLCLGWDELEFLAREPDVCIGAHSVSHPVLAKCDPRTALWEITESKVLLERRLGRPIRHLAYPFGGPTAAGPREFHSARHAGYLTAITSQPGHIFPDHAAHLHALPRVSINGLFQNETALRALLSGVPFLLWNGRRIVRTELSSGRQA